MSDRDTTVPFFKNENRELKEQVKGLHKKMHQMLIQSQELVRLNQMRVNIQEVMDVESKIDRKEKKVGT